MAAELETELSMLSINDTQLTDGATLNRLGALHILSESISKGLGVQELLNAVIDVVFAELRVDNGSILLCDESGKYLEMAVSKGLPPQARNAKILLGDGIAGKVAQTGNPLLTQGATSRSQKATPERPVSSLCAPIQFRGRLHGVICANLMNGKRSFSYKDLQMLQIMAVQTATALQNVQLMEGLKANNYATIRSLAAAVEAKDPYTRGHCDYVSSYSVEIATKFGLPTREIEEIKIGAILHDVGKIGIHEKILTKADRLTDEEFAIMKQHPIASARIVEPLNLPQNCIHVIKYHHERPDGKGYPFGLSGDEIYFGARIVAVADTFDAITSNRPYRQGKPIEFAVAELTRGSGSQFDPTVVRVFLELLMPMMAQGKLRPHLLMNKPENLLDADLQHKKELI